MKLGISGLAISSASAATAGFLIHVATHESIKGWVASRMAGVSIQRSIDVWLPAALTSIEVGLAVSIIYALIRKSLAHIRLPGRILVLWTLVLALQGRLVRQPLMDVVIGNPWDVAIIQNGVIWLTWLVISVVVVTLVDRSLVINDKS